MSHLKASSKSAFTLIETLIAAVLVVTVLGTAVMANRAIQSASLRAEDSVQMSALANEALTQVRLLKDSQAGSLAATLGMNQNGDSIYLAFIGNEVETGCSYGGGACNKIEAGGPVRLNWCREGICNYASDSPVCLHSATCSVFQEIDQALGAGGKGVGDYLAIRRQAYPASQNQDQNRQIVDLQNPLAALGGNALQVDRDFTEWNFYSRIIQITCVGSGGSLDFQQADQPANLRAATYLVTVTITNLNSPQNTVSKTIVLTDWQ